MNINFVDDILLPIYGQSSLNSDTDLSILNKYTHQSIQIYIYKGKGHPATGRGGPRPRIFLTFRHYKCGRSSAKRTGRLYPRRNPWYSLSEVVSTTWKKFLLKPPGIEPGTVHYATPGPKYIYIYIFNNSSSNIMPLGINHSAVVPNSS